MFILYFLALLGFFSDLSDGNYLWALLDILFPIVGAIRCFR